ncbi:MAG: hypothetical protein HUU02_03920 [Bacteroidetes bacterium]|nr:hypothetical protein [Bacteroidota bacterium]
MSAERHKPDPQGDKPGCRYIFRASRMVNGKKQVAKDFGLKAWRIPVKV